jgi:hypothetical protein
MKELDLLPTTAADLAEDRFKANIAVSAAFVSNRRGSRFLRILNASRALVLVFGFAEKDSSRGIFWALGIEIP